jgi:hypothetical protein
MISASHGDETEGQERQVLTGGGVPVRCAAGAVVGFGGAVFHRFADDDGGGVFGAQSSQSPCG